MLIINNHFDFIENLRLTTRHNNNMYSFIPNLDKYLSKTLGP